MDKNAIKKYAIWARNELIARVTQKAEQYEITEENTTSKDTESIGGRVLTEVEKNQRKALIEKIETDGFEQVMEEAAYTWFNRFTALRFMEVNGYLPSHVRVFTNDVGEFRPQILTEAIHLELDGLNMDKVYELKNANKNEELFKYLLITQCNALSGILPRMFQKIEDYTELLLPDYLLREGSVIDQMIALIPEEDWTDQVQIIGWLYQYYNSEPKDSVFAALKKNVKISKENIPAATQLFTPDWIVRYMVENSLGRLWLEGHPNDTLKSEWKYYLDEAEQEEDVQKQLDDIRKEYAILKPEEIRCIDPCMGSGHILCYMFDVLVKIYEDYGYTAREAAGSIVENNLWGLDIDERATQLSYFAIMMKARQYDRRFLFRNIQPHVYVIDESNGLFYHEDYCDLIDNKNDQTTLRYLIEVFRDAKQYGSILSVEKMDYDSLDKTWSSLYEKSAANLRIHSLHQFAGVKISNLINQAKTMSQDYHIVVTNPPYMGNSGMNPFLSAFVKEHYQDSKSDLFSCFLERGNCMIKKNGFNCMVTMQSWMFLSSFEKMRRKMMSSYDVINLMHMENMVMGIAFGTAVTSFRNSRISNYKGTFNQIKLRDISNDIPTEFPIKNNRFSQISVDCFDLLPGMPVAYWVSDSLLKDFKVGEKLKEHGDTRQGMATSDNNRFLRYWFENDYTRIGFGCGSADEAIALKKKWYPYNKGGEFRKWYGNTEFTVNYENDGKEVKDYATSLYKTPTRTIKSISEYFKPCLSWSKVSSGNIAFRYYPKGFIFDVAGCCIFYADERDMFYDFGFINSKVARIVLNVLSPTLNYEAGHVASLPIIRKKERYDEIISLTRKNVEMAKQDWDSFEISWDYKKHPLVQSVNRIDAAFLNWETLCNERYEEVKENEIKINRVFIEIYCLTDEINSSLDDKDITIRNADKTRDIKSFISYAVGCMFGRYSLDAPGIAFAGGIWDTSKYTTFLPDKDAIIPICDDEYFEDDIVGRFVEFVEVVYGKETLEENLLFIAQALGGKGTSREIIRNYFINDFYSDHVKIYQKRPIYWLFDSGKKNGFKCLVYMHRYQPDTIARIRTDYVHEQQSRYRTSIADLEQRINNTSTSERVKLNKHLQKIQAQGLELQEYEEKIHHLADQMIEIDLDDGVKHNYVFFKDVLAKI